MAAVNHKTKRILLVEDNDELRSLYKEIFHTRGFDVLEAADGVIAIDQVLLHQPDIVLLDLMMPRQGGIGTLRIMRSTPKAKKIPVIILTALEDPMYRDLAASMAQGYFIKTEVKPFELADHVTELLIKHSE